MSAPETRTLVLTDSELRVERRDSGQMVIRGYAAVFDSWSQDLGGFIERIKPGAFSRALASGADVRFLVNHDPSLIFGRTTAGTLRLSEGARGLEFECDFPSSALAQHYAGAVERRDIDGCSFRFYAQKAQWNFDADPIQRELIEVDIDDVCLATYPAYLDTSAALRSLDEHRRTEASLRQTPRRNRAARLIRLAEIDYPTRHS